jgi:hypothetical protein
MVTNRHVLVLESYTKLKMNNLRKKIPPWSLRSYCGLSFDIEKTRTWICQFCGYWTTWWKIVDAEYEYIGLARLIVPFPNSWLGEDKSGLPRKKAVGPACHDAASVNSPNVPSDIESRDRVWQKAKG